MTKTFSIGPMTRRLLRLYDAATPVQAAAGSRWYTEARTFADSIAEGTPYTSEQVAGVIAVLSPQVSWDLNMEGAREAVHAHQTGQTVFVYSGYTANAQKALRVLDGDMDAIRGPKVMAFHRAIMGDLSACTVDVWVARACRSRLENTAKVFRADEMPGARERRAMQEAIRRTALARGTSPAEAQARCWTVVRDANPYPAPMGNDASAQKWYSRQIRARVALGLTLHTRKYAWGGAPRGQAAFTVAADRFADAGIF